jgi:uncharacterized protein
VAAQRLTIRSLRCHAINQSLFEPTTLQGAIDRLGFVQADPIRSPARAQDLILRHRVDDYRAGDLERDYATLDVEEDYLYAYGFLSRSVWQLLHPRKTSALRTFEKKVLTMVRALGETHPRVLEAHLGRRRVVNAWGGYSKATTNALEWLHWRGLLRIARRERGIRIYHPMAAVGGESTPAARLRQLVMVYANIFAPSPEKNLQSVIARHRELGNTRKCVSELIDESMLRRETVDGISYVWPAGPSAIPAAIARRVRFMAPFDPLIWDRWRFEHLWGWPYRFEAYTPVKKRVRGYYAMPMLWQDAMVGWANVTGVRGAGDLDVQIGFVGKRPRGQEFTRELDAEIERLRQFLGTPTG